jgi:phosphoribosylglycinamide formyltransferase 1
LNIVILTGAELRHDFVRKILALTPGVHVQRSYCEDVNLGAFVREQPGGNSGRLAHLEMRERSEHDFFAAFCGFAEDRSNPVRLVKGEVNEVRYVDEIKSLCPGLIVAYGCSLIKAPLLKAFNRRVLNVHLGLSPYYRGSSTNYWPLVNKTPEYVGATFMYMDEGVDTGEVIHQIRARIYKGDSPHQIGNRLICDIALVYGEIIQKLKNLKTMNQLSVSSKSRYYRRADFSENSVQVLRENFVSGMVDKYIGQKRERCKAVPIIKNPAVQTVDALMEFVQ